MEITSMFTSTTKFNPHITFSPLNTKSKPISRNNNFTSISALRRSDSNGSRYQGRQVDENMIVLRKRIHELKMLETNYEPPSEWMQWEKNLYANYDYDDYICMVLGMVQTQLINTRPSVALATMTLLALSVPTSVFFIITHLVRTAENIF
ncbi:hypothetical protein RND81_03G179500 [Saponaria officinalis]|uniref:Mediator of RNA polymerase II transcription subunit n=1 Tax=Saponaria officinalis TaxID=3572 RepID=A0AAW1M835_SAPOF